MPLWPGSGNNRPATGDEHPGHHNLAWEIAATGDAAVLLQGWRVPLRQSWAERCRSLRWLWA